MFADVAGYSALTAQVAGQHGYGAEIVAQWLQAIFQIVEDEVLPRGGDIGSFGGDSVCAFWYPTQDLDSGSTSHLSAAQDAATAIHARLANLQLVGQDKPIRMRIGVSLGNIKNCAYLEGLSPSVLLTRGSAIDAAIRGANVAEPGHTVVMDSMAEVDTVPLHKRLAPETGGKPCDPERFKSEFEKGANNPFGMTHAVEYQTASCLFIQLRSGVGEDKFLDARVHKALLAAQSCVRQFGGHFARARYDDKGLVFLCLWGVAGHVYEDGSHRAMQAALGLQRILHADWNTLSLAVCTGRVLCSWSGGRTRYEHTVTGMAVNLAASMCSKVPTVVVCDTETKDQCNAVLSWNEPTLMVPKGMVDSVPVWTVLNSNSVNSESVFTSQVLAGRELVLGRALVALTAESVKSRVVLLNGPAGIGKSAVLAQLTLQVAQRGWQVSKLGCFGARQSTAYGMWRGMVESWVHILQNELQSGRLTKPTARAGSPEMGELLSWLPVLNDIAPTGLAETTPTLRMSERGRAEALVELVVTALSYSTDNRFHLLAIEDVHWMDTASASLVSQILKRCPQVHFLATERSNNETIISDFARISPSSGMQTIQVLALSWHETQLLVASRLGRPHIAQSLVNTLYEASQGNPLFICEMLRILQQNRYIEIVADTCMLVTGNQTRNPLPPLPGSVQLLIASQLDSLLPQEKELLRIASVIGDVFDLGLLCKVANVPQSLPRELLGRSMAQGFVVPVEGLNATLRYHHALWRDVVYASLTQERRSQIHGMVAQTIAADIKFAADVDAPDLARHWLAADDARQAYYFSIRAGRQAFAKFANHEAITFLKAADQLTQANPTMFSRSELLTPVRMLGYAYFHAGRLGLAHDALVRSFTLSGQPVQVREILVTFATFGYALLYGLRSMLRGNFLIADTSTLRKTSNQAFIPEEGSDGEAFANFRLGQISYLAARPKDLHYLAMRSLLSGEHTQAWEVLALVYSGIALSFAKLNATPTLRLFVKGALDASRRAANRSIRGEIFATLAVLDSGIAQWQRGLRRIRLCQAAQRSYGDSRKASECAVVLGYLQLYRGNFEQAAAAFQQCFFTASNSGDIQTTTWGILGLSRVALFQGRTDLTRATVTSLTIDEFDGLSRLDQSGQMVMICLMESDWAAALRLSNAAMPLMQQGALVSYSSLFCLAAVVQGRICGFGQSVHSVPAHGPKRERQDALKGLKLLHNFATTYPLAWPLYWLLLGQFRYLDGSSGRAVLHWNESLRIAKKLDMPTEANSAISCVNAIRGGYSDLLHLVTPLPLWSKPFLSLVNSIKTLK